MIIGTVSSMLIGTELTIPIGTGQSIPILTACSIPIGTVRNIFGTALSITIKQLPIGTGIAVRCVHCIVQQLAPSNPIVWCHLVQ